MTGGPFITPPAEAGESLVSLHINSGSLGDYRAVARCFQSLDDLILVLSSEGL